jgi:hypothetical protein
VAANAENCFWLPADDDWGGDNWYYHCDQPVFEVGPGGIVIGVPVYWPGGPFGLQPEYVGPYAPVGGILPGSENPGTDITCENCGVPPKEDDPKDPCAPDGVGPTSPLDGVALGMAGGMSKEELLKLMHQSRDMNRAFEVSRYVPNAVDPNHYSVKAPAYKPPAPTLPANMTRDQLVEWLAKQPRDIPSDLPSWGPGRDGFMRWVRAVGVLGTFYFGYEIATNMTGGNELVAADQEDGMAMWNDVASYGGWVERERERKAREQRAKGCK